MQWFYNLKIATKLLIAFVSVLVLTVLLGVFSIAQLAKVNQSAAEMERLWLPSTRAIMQVKSDLARFRSIELQYVNATGGTETNFYEGSILDILADFNRDRDLFVGLASDEQSKKVLASFNTAFDRYIGEHQKAIDLIKAEKSWDVPALLKGSEIAEASSQLNADIDELIKINAEGVARAGEAGAALYTRSRMLIGGGLGLSIFLSLFLAIWVARIVARPLKQAVDIAQRVAGGDLTATFEITSKDETGHLMQSLKEMNDSLTKIVGQVRQGTETIATASSQIAAGNLDLSQRTEQQASSLVQTASSMEEMTSTVMQNADNVKQANDLATVASGEATKGGAVLAQAVDTMELINTSSRKIVDIISVIDGIAFQTNILALNAAVEAARAGAEGRGFAVVAAEVRTLAQRSAAAAKEIKDLIDDSVQQVDTGTLLVNQAGSTMGEIVASVERVTSIMTEITAASREQASGIEQINQAINEMDVVTQHNAALVEQAAAATESLRDQANNLTELVGVFKLVGDQSGAAEPQVAYSESLDTTSSQPLVLAYQAG